MCKELKENKRCSEILFQIYNKKPFIRALHHTESLESIYKEYNPFQIHTENSMLERKQEMHSRCSFTSVTV
jgi:hypothetical protein